MASGAVGGTVPAAERDALANLFKKVAFIEAFIRMELKKKGSATSPAAVVADAKRKRGGLKGYRTGMHAQPAVGFDAVAKRAKPLCPRCPGGAYHGWRECPLGVQTPEHAGTAAAFYAPRATHGAPAVLHGDREPTGGIDLSAYGFVVDRRGASEDSDDSDDEDLDDIRELKKQVENAAARRGVSFTHASFAPQPVAAPPAAVLPQPAADAPLAAAGRWQNRASLHAPLAAAAVSMPHAQVQDTVVPEPQGPWMRGPDGLDRPVLARDDSCEAPGEQTPASMHRLAIGPGDSSESDENDDNEFEEYLAADRTAYASGKVVAAAPAPGGAFPPAGFHTVWDMPLERTRERLAAGGASHFPNPPYDSPSPRPLDALADSLTVALEPDVLAAYQQGFLAALRLRDSPGAVPGAGGTAAGDALRTVVPPPGGEIDDLTAEDAVPEDEDKDTIVDAGAVSEQSEI
ncbi:hypothetical protein CYMTET_40409 [Cymbomonas tetramitiformis]|uniref:Uncharacterized protein n=1 Tax=Cymbomonas tetramitiformis TaxID=36881 RepID=A0AAE0C9I3_9CHLO|nr:hypothetical protein CYMTET_40409 [Cymbomonas tetramitiformis]